MYSEKWGRLRVRYRYVVREGLWVVGEFAFWAVMYIVKYDLGWINQKFKVHQWTSWLIPKGGGGKSMSKLSATWEVSAGVRAIKRGVGRGWCDAYRRVPKGPLHRGQL
jgi:hypothetical protein